MIVSRWFACRPNMPITEGSTTSCRDTCMDKFLSRTACSRSPHSLEAPTYFRLSFPLPYLLFLLRLNCGRNVEH